MLSIIHAYQVESRHSDTKTIVSIIIHAVQVGSRPSDQITRLSMLIKASLPNSDDFLHFGELSPPNSRGFRGIPGDSICAAQGNSNPCFGAVFQPTQGHSDPRRASHATQTASFQQFLARVGGATPPNSGGFRGTPLPGLFGRNR